MLLSLDANLAAGYNNKAQIARRVSEHWGLHNLYCSACDSNVLTQSPNNTPAVDFVCPQCKETYQLKSRATWSERKVADADYDKMMAAVNGDISPNLFVMQYTQTWQVKRLLLVPSFFFSASAIEKRNPLGPNARRAGWVGCNILLSSIAPEGKLSLVNEGIVSNASHVRQQYQQMRPLSGLSVLKRGWTLDILNVISGFRKRSFTLSEVYGFEAHLAALHPENHRVREKIRQQLQVLRDYNLLQFLGRGEYRLTAAASTQS